MSTLPFQASLLMFFNHIKIFSDMECFCSGRQSMPQLALLLLLALTALSQLEMFRCKMYTAVNISPAALEVMYTQEGL